MEATPPEGPAAKPAVRSAGPLGSSAVNISSSSRYSDIQQRCLDVCSCETPHPFCVAAEDLPDLCAPGSAAASRQAGATWPPPAQRRAAGLPGQAPQTAAAALPPTAAPKPGHAWPAQTWHQTLLQRLAGLEGPAAASGPPRTHSPALQKQESWLVMGMAREFGGIVATSLQHA